MSEGMFKRGDHVIVTGWSVPGLQHGQCCRIRDTKGGADPVRPRDGDTQLVQVDEGADDGDQWYAYYRFSPASSHDLYLAYRTERRQRVVAEGTIKKVKDAWGTLSAIAKMHV